MNHHGINTFSRHISWYVCHLQWHTRRSIMYVVCNCKVDPHPRFKFNYYLPIALEDGLCSLTLAMHAFAEGHYQPPAGSTRIVARVFLDRKSRVTSGLHCLLIYDNKVIHLSWLIMPREGGFAADHDTEQMNSCPLSLLKQPLYILVWNSRNGRLVERGFTGVAVTLARVETVL
jgi:hypothetical protein